MAGLASEGSQFDPHQLDSKMNEFNDGQDFFTSYDEVNDSFDAMGLQENLLRGIYAYSFEKPLPVLDRNRYDDPEEEKNRNRRAMESFLLQLAAEQSTPSKRQIPFLPETFGKEAKKKKE